jgi:hypothetical protein
MKTAHIVTATSVFACLLWTGCSAGAPSVGSTARARGAVSIPTPALAANPGLLCFTSGEYDPPPPTGFDGWVSTTVPQSRAVLGGSGLGLGGMIANTTLQFQVTALSDSLQWGDRQEVCAEASAVSSCTTLLACWSGSGTGTIEVSSSPQCDPSIPATRTVYATASLPPLTTGATYDILLLWFLDSHQVDAIFEQNGSIVGYPTSNQIGVFSSVGFGGYRANRVQVRANVAARPASVGPLVQTTSVGRVGQQLPDGSVLGCSYLAPPLMGLSASVQTMAPAILTWQSPPGGNPSQFHTCVDGRSYAIGPVVVPGTEEIDAVYDPLVNHRVHYQLTYVDANGNLSEAADTLAPAVAAPISPLLADGNLNLGVVLVRYADSLPPSEGFGGRKAAVAAKIFNSSAGAYSLASYVREASAGRASVTGGVMGWITLTDANGNPLTGAADCAGHPSLDPTTWVNCNFGSPSADPYAVLTAQARAAGFPVDSYEQLVFYVAGLTKGDSGAVFGEYGLYMTDPDGLPSLNLLVHELGHILGFPHTYLQLCPGTNLLPTTNNCSRTAGVNASAATTGFPTPFDGQVSTAWHMSDWNSIYQYQQGWLTDAEVIYANAGTPDATYALAPLGAAGAGARQVRVEIAPDAFYFAEYRDGSGFTGPGPFDNRVGGGSSFATEQVYRSEVGVTVWLRPPQVVGNFYSPNVVASSLGPGDYYCDSGRQVAIRVVSLGATASVRVERGACVVPALDPLCPIDNQVDGSETGVDCGGPCAPCGLNFRCQTSADCASGFCGPTGICLAPTCGDGVRDGTETDLDCGGVACTPCGLGQLCNAGTDCQSSVCVASHSNAKSTCAASP